MLLGAFVVRLILIPSLMTIFGTTNWWLPGWLSRLLPNISVESKEDIEASDEEIVDITEPVRRPSPRPYDHANARHVHGFGETSSRPGSSPAAGLAAAWFR